MTNPHAPSLRRLLNQLPQKYPVEAACPELAREPKGGYIIFRNHTIRSTGPLHVSASFALLLCGTDCTMQEGGDGVIGLGTIINVALILAGGLVGTVGGRLFTPHVQETLMKATGLSVLFVGLSGALAGMLSLGKDGALVSGGSMLIVASFAAGALVGELVDLDGKFERLGIWLKERTGNAGDPSFVNAFVTASLTVCIGAMAIVGSIQDGLTGDWSTLALKGALDALIVCVMTASMGRGCIFSALPVGVFQGSITLLARLIQPLMTAEALANLSLVGSILIFCVGVNLIWEKTFKTANMLPAVVFAVVLAFV